MATTNTASNGTATEFLVPTEMKAIRYHKLKDFSLVTMPVPQPQGHGILVQVRSARIYGMDLHIYNGDFQSALTQGKSVVTGHETSRIVGKRRERKKGFQARRQGHGGQFGANCSWEEASLFEAASCAIHGLDRIRPEAGSNILLIGASPTGLCLAQLLKTNGGAPMVLASNEVPKMELAKRLNCADEYVELSRKDPAKQWADLKIKYPYGFDVVVEASGSHVLLEQAIDCCTRGGKLYYGVYQKSALINVSPQRVLQDEITMVG
ncbi:D-arabinitol dehydrogenase [Lachnellula willkommii]|uniref:D-arabinitol dehydrogenase n=1 Tax=Lachnellula willkommii TaxID=215461 RepID=A0A559M6H7_9HELO|nr:D-arabinitol dehydrogenase [Lachnellula willkommii]